MQRRSFIRILGGGTIAAAVATHTTGCISSNYPNEALEVWRGPSAQLEARRWAVANAITAPNPHNLQPWLVDLREANTITVYTDPTRVLPHTDPVGRQIMVGHGAFLELLVMALAQRGLDAKVLVWPKGEMPATLSEWDRRPVARIELTPKAGMVGADDNKLFAHVLKRHTPKSAFDLSRSLRDEDLSGLMACVKSGAICGGTLDAKMTAKLRTLCLDAAMVEVNTERTVLESIKLLRVGPSEILQHRDGISINTPLVRALKAVGMLDRSNAPKPGDTAYRETVRRFADQAQTAMGFVWLSTPTNSRGDQIGAGRAFVRLQLQATAAGIGIHPLSQAIQEFPEMATQHAQAHRLCINQPAPTSMQSPTLQMLCRLGHPVEAPSASPRRPIAAFDVS